MSFVQQLSALEGIVGKENIVTDQQALKRQAVDYVGYRLWERFNGQYLTKQSRCIVKVQNTEQVASVMKYLNDNNISTIPVAGNSSCTGSIEPIEDISVVVDCSAMNEIIKFDEENMLVTVQCGVGLADLEDYLNAKGYTTGHYPQSLPMARIGGLLATRSTGQFSTLYGGIEDLVVGLEAVLPNGEIVRIKNVPRRAIGPDLRQIFIGSEGTYAYITEASLKLFKYNPENYWKMAYGVKSMQHGLDLIQEVMKEGYKPAVVRLHDEIEASAPHYDGYMQEGESLLLFIADGPKALTEATGKAIEEIAAKHNARTIGPELLDIWLKVRNHLCDIINDLPANKNGLVADTSEVSANWSEVSELYYNVKNRIEAEIENLDYVTAHSSHSYMQGTNLYFMFGFKAYEDYDQTREQYMKLLGIIMDETLKIGGSIAHHHGCGKYRAGWSKEEHGSSYQVMRAIKDTFDPNGVMNLGTLFPVE